MHKVGDKVVYGTDGVMAVVDIREETVMGEVRRYYVLGELDSRSDSKTFVPVDNEKLTSLMRPLLSKDEIYAMLDSVNDMSELPWEGDNKARIERFRKIIASGDRAEMISMIRSIYKSGERREREGRRIFLSDEHIMKKAEKLLHTEISAVLGIPEADVPAFIEERINGK